MSREIMEIFHSPSRCGNASPKCVDYENGRITNLLDHNHVRAGGATYLVFCSTIQENINTSGSVDLGYESARDVLAYYSPLRQDP